MSRLGFSLAAIALAAAIGCGAAFAQSPASPTAIKRAPVASAADASAPSTAAQVETWTAKQWDAAKKKWSKDKAKWSDCQKQSNAQKLEGRKSWSFTYTCMTS